MSATSPRPTERGSLIVPVTAESMGLPAEGGRRLDLSGIALFQKREHHLTVLNYPIGKLLKQALKADPELAPPVFAACDTFEWTIAPKGEHYHLVDRRPDKPPPLHTVIVLVEAPIARFYEQLHALAVSRGPDRHAELAAALLAPPPPHVTLFTSDPDGALGIGLNREADLPAAVARAAAGQEGLWAHRLAPEIRDQYSFGMCL